MPDIAGRAASALFLTVILGGLFWLGPDFGPESVGIQSPTGVMWLFVPIFFVFFVYLVMQGWPISHGNIGSSSTHNLDNIISGVPAIVALFGFLLHVGGFRPLSTFNLLIAAMTFLVVGFDLWVLGGAAAKINRLTDEYKSER
jgi:hypothetical protein